MASDKSRTRVSIILALVMLVLIGGFVAFRTSVGDGYRAGTARVGVS